MTPNELRKLAAEATPAALIAALGPPAATILADAIDALEGVIADIDWRSSTAEDVIARFYALGNGR